RDLSGGMRRRIGIARALLGSPPIVIVDEPTTGLDVESRQRLRDSLLRAAGERIILFSTHIASDIATTAARILILDGGRLCFDGAPDALIDSTHGRVFERLLSDAELRDFSTRYRVTTRVRTLDGIRVRAVATVDQKPAGELVRPNLEEAYLATLGHGLRAPGGERRTGSLLDLDV
ncbi:MAG: ATP-binding cassette domain-containing protein, partial [Acidobacteriota bacterium]